MEINDKRKYAAYLARQFYSSKKNIRLVEDEFPFEENDKEIDLLFKMIKNTPKRKGIFKASKEKYQNYIMTVYSLIEKLEN